MASNTVFKAQAVAIGAAANVAVPHGLNINGVAIKPPFVGAWEDAAGVSGQQPEIVSWDATNINVRNPGAAPSTFTVEALAYPGYADLQTQPAKLNTVLEAVTPIAGGGSQAYPNPCVDYGVTEAIRRMNDVCVTGGTSTSGWQRWVDPFDLVAGRTVFNDDPNGGNSLSVNPMVGSLYSPMRVPPGLSPLNCLYSLIGPITIPSAGFNLVTHLLQQQGVDKVPDFSSAIVVGSTAEGVALTAVAYLCKTQVSPTQVRWENHGATSITIYAAQLYTWSAIRMP